MIIAVASGKGGTGKTLVATSLALSLTGIYDVQLLDCDVEEPNDHILLKPYMVGSEAVAIPVPEVDEERCTHCGRCAEVCAYHAIMVLSDCVMTFPELCHGCGTCSYLCPEEAIVEKDRQTGLVEWGYTSGMTLVHGRLTLGEAMAGPVIRKVKRFINDHNITIIDVPPGTSCPVVEAIKGSDFCVLVTEPTPFGLNDLILAVKTVRELNIPFGVVLNRVGIGDFGVQKYCREESIPILLSIPLDTKIARLYSRGIPLVEGFPTWRASFNQLFKGIEETISEGNRCIKR